jgi:hypothetical protein
MMKPALPLLWLALLAGCAAPPAQTPTEPPGQVAAAQNSICLKSYMIDHTSVPDDRTILFYMRDGKVWQNNLPLSCPGLSYQSGFEFVASFDEVCSNAQAIKVLWQNSQCELGAFTPYVAPKAQ